jgi:hypothetical protein
VEREESPHERDHQEDETGDVQEDAELVTKAEFGREKLFADEPFAENAGYGDDIGGDDAAKRKGTDTVEGSGGADVDEC